MFEHIIRIRYAILRLPLLVVCFPFVLLHYLVSASLPVALGGHPNGNRIFEASFWQLPIALFWAAWDGEFVP